VETTCIRRDHETTFFQIQEWISAAVLWEYKKKFNLSIPILVDESGSVAKAYKVWGHHVTFFINREWKIVGKAFVEKDWTSASMRNLIQHLLEQK
jgi:peroxiredoxin